MIIKKKKEFCDMTKPEKKEFLTMDLADRIIRIEQKVSAHFNKYINYRETDYYNNLNNCDKKRYEKFRKQKIVKNILILSFITLPIILLLLFNINLTANVIKTNFGISDLSSAQFFIWIFGMIFTFIVVYIALKNRESENLEDSHLMILNKLHVRKHLHKKF